MFAAERQKQIYQFLQQQHMATIREMAQRFDVSETTVRRDLETMELSGMVKRTYGGAVVVDGSSAEPPYRLRETDQSAVKNQLAEVACGLIRNGELIFMDTSSTVNCMVRCHKMAEFGNISVVSNCVKTVMQLSKYHNITVYSAGGKLRENSNSILGLHSADFFQHFYADVAFLSCRGMDLIAGVTEANEEEAQLKRALLSRAQRKVLLCDSAKIGKRYSCLVADLSQFDTLITDYVFAEEEKHLLRQKNVTLLNCPKIK